MQNTMMLDSVVSSNSQELSNASSAIKLFENPLFKARVIMRCSEPWFVAKDVATCIEHKDVSTMCRMCRDKDMAVINGKEYSADLAEYSESRGNPTLTVISESGLYRILAKCNLPKCEPFENWVFDEVLPSIRKTGGYGIRTVDDMINDPDTAIRLLTQLKILRLQNDQLAMERDEAIRTKARIGSNREATAMATASAKSRECKRLTAENAELKDAVGRGKDWHTVNMMTDEWKREFGHAPSWQKLREFSADLPKEMKPVRDVEVKVVLQNGSEKVSKLFRYHREAWAKYREYEENRRAKGKNVPDTKILDLSATNTEIEYF